MIGYQVTPQRPSIGTSLEYCLEATKSLFFRSSCRIDSPALSLKTSDPASCPLVVLVRTIAGIKAFPSELAPRASEQQNGKSQ